MSDALCSATEFGIECRYSAVMTEPVPLCGEHRIQLALLLVPEVLTEALRNAQTGAVSRTVPEDERRALVAGARPVEVDDHLAGTHAPSVYFIANGARVKIGTSTSLRSRVSSLALRADDALLLLRGGPILERALHAEFAVYRIANTEWFSLAEPIVNYVEEKNAQLAEEAKALGEQADAVRFHAEQALGALELDDASPTCDGEMPGEPAPGRPEPEPKPKAEPGPTYPDGTEILPKNRVAWAAFCDLGSATIDEMKALQLPSHHSRDTCKTTLQVFVVHSGARSERDADGRSERFHCLVGPERRKEA